METRVPMSALQKIFATCWFFIKSNFISLVNPPCESARGLFLLEAAARMFVWVLNTPLILLKLLSPYMKRPTQKLVRRLEWMCLLE